MALYTEKSFADIAGGWEDMQRRQRERQMQELANRYSAAQNNYDQAQGRKVGALESVLSGIGSSIKNVGDSLYNMFGTGGAAVRDLFTGNAGTGKYQKEWKDYVKESQYGDANMSDKDYYLKTGGKAVDAAATVSDLIPGLGKAGRIGLNVAQGVASGAVNPLIEYGGNVSADDILRGAAVGGASAGVGQYVGNKLASTAKLPKMLNNNIGRAAITGGLAGATGGGLNTALSGGDLGQTLSGALQGAQSGALGGATMAGTMGLLGTGIDRLRGKYGQTPTPDTEIPKALRRVANQTQDVEQPTTMPTRRNIPVTDYDAGEQQVRVRRPDTEYSLGRKQGSNIDGILSPDNARQLPNAQKRSFADLFGDENIKTAADAISANELDDPMAYLRDADNNIPKDLVNDIESATRDYHDTQQLDGAGYVNNKSGLPKIKRSEYELYTGLKGKDIPEYMQRYLSEENGVSLSDGATWGDILTNARGEGAYGGSADDILSLYERAANTNARDIYTPENIEAGLRTNPELNNRLSAAMVEDTFPTRKIDVKAAPSIADNIDVDSASTPNVIKRTLNQSQAPEQQTRMAARPIRRSAETSTMATNPNLDPSDVARLEREYTVNRQRQGAALLEQYGTLDAPVRRSLGSPEDVLATLYDDYGLRTPADVQYAANHVTGRDGVVSQMTRELARGAENVDTTINKQWLQDMMDNNGLLDDEQKTVVKQITGALKRGGQDVDGSTALDVMKQLEKQSARYKGKDGTYHHGTESEARKALVLDLVHDEIQDRLWEAAGDPQKVLTPNRLTGLKNMYKDNEAWANFVDNKLGKVRSGAELRATMKPLVDGSKIVNGSKMSAGGFAERAAKAATSRNSGVALAQLTVDAIADSDAAKARRANSYANKAARAKAQLTGTEAPKIKGQGLVGTAKNIAGKVGDKISGVNNMLNNDTLSNTMLGTLANRQLTRQPGLAQLSNANADARSNDALQEMQNVQNEYNMLQSQPTYAEPQQTSQAPSALDRISTAMDLALSAGDMTAYSQLADLYKQAYNIYSLQNPTAPTETKALTANQTKALTGLQQLQSLSTMQPGLGTALANSPVGGIVNMFGGDEYANQAQSLALTLGYLQSGANITPREAENIGKAYIPTAYDAQQVRQQKLSRAEQLLRNYLADTSTLQGSY